ncbi:MAG: PKD domain-containing protein, partial [Ferruginibacter sp.]
MIKKFTLFILSCCLVVFSLKAQTNCELLANFTLTNNGNVFHFVNTSVGLSATDSIRWTFGDGTSSTQINPTHTYAQAGTYNVCIRIKKRNSIGVVTNCVREICHTISVTATPQNCEMVAGFNFTNIGNAFHFTNTSVGFAPNDSIRWTFGDGTSSTQINPTHSYALAGTYNVCIRIQKRNSIGVVTNCVREICHTVSVLSS